MNRIATRLGSLLLYSVIAVGAASACASEDSTFRPNPVASTGGATGSAGAAGATQKLCDPMYCPQHPPAMPCCATPTECGLNYGTMCIPNTKKDSGTP